MYHSVTAILVVHNGVGATSGSTDSDHLKSTLDALAAQTRQPDSVIAVACDAPESALQMLQEFGVTQIVTSTERLSFGDAVAAGVRVLPESRAASEMLWLLAQDTAPAENVLARLAGALEVAPSVAVAGPKLVDAADGVTIVSLGETITYLGTTVPLVEDELDQGQHDTESDVLAVAPAGMLVRRTVWDELGGFDPALSSADDSLDFSVRARLAGHRVEVVPGATVFVRGDGVAGTNRSPRASVRRRRARQARAAQLHRRLVYAPAVVVWMHWLSLVPIAFIRSIWRLVIKQPELIGAELAAAFQIAFSGNKVGTARRSLQRIKHTGWSSIRPLRIPAAEVRRRNRLRREASAGFYTVERTELNFFGGGGAWTVLASAVASVALFFSLLPATSVLGGGLLPLSGTVQELWGNVGWVWHEAGLGFAGAADPFAAVLAVLGTITFWDPSYSLVLLWLLALPLATLGGWFAATRLTERSGYRITAAILWTVAPTFWSALVDGRPAAVIAHLLLPWVFFAGVVAARSWAAAGIASILLAATLAASPSLTPAFVVLWVVAVAVAGKHVARAVWLLIPSAALFAPLIWQQGVLRGAWLQLLADPGQASAWSAASGWQLSTGFPTGNNGWAVVAETLQFDGIWASLAAPILLAPLAVLAVSALFLPGSLRAAVLLVTGLLGLVTAVGAAHLSLVVDGSSTVPIWSGAGLSLYWLGVSGAAIVALDSLRRAGTLPAIVVTVLSVLAVTPLAAMVPAGHSQVVAANDRTLPAYVTAAAQQDPAQGTLVIAPQADGGVVARIVRGAGLMLDERSTVASTTARVTGADEQIAELTGNLVAQSGLDAAPLLSELGLRFVLLAPPGADAAESPDAAQRAAVASAALDGNPALVHVGPTDRGTLWRFDGDVVAQDSTDRMPWMAALVAIGLAVVFGIALLLSVPTAASRRIAEMTPRTVGRRPSELERPRRRSAAERAEDLAESEAERALEREYAREHADDTSHEANADTASVAPLDTDEAAQPTADDADTVGTAGADTAETAGADTVGTARTVDAVDTGESADMADTPGRADTGEAPDTADTADRASGAGAADTGETGGTADTASGADARADMGSHTPQGATWPPPAAQREPDDAGPRTSASVERTDDPPHTDPENDNGR
ncbi:hypothetical protein GCM10027416_05700 [Okibacterium endophyticum]